MSSLHHDAVVVDCHNDQPFLLGMWHRSLGEPNHFREHSIPELRAGGVDVQIMPIYTWPPTAEAALRHALLAIEWLNEEVEKNADVVALCRTGAEIDAAVAEGNIALLLSLEGCPMIGHDVELFRT